MLRGCGLPIVDEIMVILPLFATPAHKHAPCFEGRYLTSVVQKRCCLQLRAASLGCPKPLKARDSSYPIRKSFGSEASRRQGPLRMHNEGAAGQGAFRAPFLSA